VKSRRAKAHHIGIPRATKGAEQPQIRRGFQQVGLAVPVFPHDHEAGGGNRHVEAREVAIVARGQVLKHGGRAGARRVFSGQ
jgi:hypothetical protein